LFYLTSLNNIGSKFIEVYKTTKKFRVTIDEEQCKGCLLCVHVCNTRGGRVLKESENKTALGGTKPEVDGECIGCRWCERYCPDFAINVEEIEDA
jgi:2-oxoglutarate ferredoxin oxidoreductase subunit delta